MYTADNLKDDIIANLNGDDRFPPLILPIIRNCTFQFNDTNSFTRIAWNTYERNLIIFCAADNRSELEKYKDILYSLCSKIHGTQDDYIIMSLEIIAKNNIPSATNTNSLTADTITIVSKIIINRATDEIGHGGFGTVYKYYNEAKEQLFAIKIYEPSIFQASSSEIMKKRFIREGKKLTGYSHPNVVKAFDYGFLGDDSAYILMEFISGSRLSDYVTEHKSMSVTLVNNLCYQYISAMSYIHSQTDMHRDISYSNIMITCNNEVKVLDFGFARNSEDTDYDTHYKDISHNFAPRDEKYTVKTEVYCIGAILYTLITGTIWGNYDEQLINKSDCDEKLKDATKICLSLQPENRFDDAVKLNDFIHSASASSRKTNFPLDFFKDIVKRSVTMHTREQNLPDTKDIEKWFETDYRDFIDCSTFQSTINLISLLAKIPKITYITYNNDLNYDMKKTNFVEILNFYDSLAKDKQHLFIRNIHMIILESTKADDTDLPFM